MFNRVLKSAAVLALSCVLATSTALSGFSQRVYAEPLNASNAEAAAPTPVENQGLIASAPVGPATTLIESNIPVTCFTSGNEQETYQGIMQSGSIAPSRTPKWEGHSFLHAWLRSPESPGHQLGITQINYNEASPDNGMPNGEAYVEVALAHNDPSKAKLCVPLSKAAQFIWLEYAKTGKIIDLKYNKDSSTDIDIAGPPQILTQPDGVAAGVFSVSVPRNYAPSVSFAFENKDIHLRKVGDVSTPDRTIFRYEIVADPQFAEDEIIFNVSAQKKGKLNVQTSTFEPDDWKTLYPVPGTKYPSIFGPVSNSQVDYGGSASFNIYCDRISPLSFFASSTMLAFLKLRDDPNTGDYTRLAPAQPFLRYGLNAYDLSRFYFGGVSLGGQTYGPFSAPYYDMKNQGNIAMKVRMCPFFVQSFSEIMGWNMSNAKGSYDFHSWYNSQIKDKTLGMPVFFKSYEISSGPLAGTMVDISILNILPSNAEGDLGNPNAQPWLKTPEEGNAYGNALRIAYRVELRNITNSVFADTEWAHTKNVKVGVYENYGVENIQAQASGVGYQPNYNNIDVNNQNKLPWLNVPNAQGDAYIDLKSLAGVKAGYFKGIEFPWTSGTSLSLRGNVMNGYKEPKPSAPNNLFDYVMKPLTIKTQNVSGGYGFETNFPVPAMGTDTVTSNVRYAFGGMSSVGVRASLMKIPVYFDLNGGQVEKPNLFPAPGAGNATSYDVLGKPVVYLPAEIPYKIENNMKSYSLYWKLFYKDGKTGKLVDTGKTFYPSTSFDIRDIEDIGTRLSDKSGNVITKEFILKATFEGKPGDNALVYRPTYELSNSEGKLVETVPGDAFWGMKGLYAQPMGFPNEIVGKDGKTYYLKAGFNLNHKVLLGDSSSPAYEVPYSSETMAERWAREHGARPNPDAPFQAVGRVQEYPYGTTMTRDELKKMIVNNKFIEDNVKITPNPVIDPYLIGGQGTVLTLTFPDGSTLEPQCTAVIQSPVMTGLSTGGGAPWILALGALGAATTAGLVYTLRRRRMQTPITHGRHAR